MTYNYCFKLPRKKHQCDSFPFIHLSFLLVSSQERIILYPHVFNTPWIPFGYIIDVIESQQFTVGRGLGRNLSLLPIWCLVNITKTSLISLSLNTSNDGGLMTSWSNLSHLSIFFHCMKDFSKEPKVLAL